MRVPRFLLHLQGEYPAFIRRLFGPPRQRIRPASSSRASNVAARRCSRVARRRGQRGRARGSGRVSFSTSSRMRPLKLSTKPFRCGLPGAMDRHLTLRGRPSPGWRSTSAPSRNTSGRGESLRCLCQVGRQPQYVIASAAVAISILPVSGTRAVLDILDVQGLIG